VQFEVNMRDGSTFEIEASYIEVSHEAASSTYALLGAVPGYPSAILAVFPTDEAVSVLPAGVGPTTRRIERASA